MGTRLSQLAALPAGGIAGTDLVQVVDVSDTSMASTGTNKRSTVAAFLTPPNNSIPLGGSSNRWSALYTVALNASGASELAAVTTTTISATGVVVLSGEEVYSGAGAGILRIAGGASAGDGAFIQVSGPTHATVPGRVYLSATGTGPVILRAGVVEHSFASDGTVTLGGALRLGVAYAAGAPAATGYITVKDSSGTTYKLLCST